MNPMESCHFILTCFTKLKHCKFWVLALMIELKEVDLIFTVILTMKIPEPVISICLNCGPVYLCH